MSILKKCGHHCLHITTRSYANRFTVIPIHTPKIAEADEYEHVGVKNCRFSDYRPRVEDRISKGRRSFNSILNSGIKR